MIGIPSIVGERGELLLLFASFPDPSWSPPALFFPRSSSDKEEDEVVEREDETDCSQKIHWRRNEQEV